MEKVDFSMTLPIYYVFKRKTKPSKTVLVGMNNYRNWHFHDSNDIKAHYHQVVKDAVKGKKFNKIRVKYDIYIKRNGTDGHNIRSIIEKFFLDGLVSAGAIEDDCTPQYVVSDSTEYFMDKENPRAEISIYEIV